MGDYFNTIHHYKAIIHWSYELIKLHWYWNKTFQDQNDNNLPKLPNDKQSKNIFLIRKNRPIIMYHWYKDKNGAHIIDDHQD